MGEDKEIEGGVGTGLRSLLEEAEQSSDLEKNQRPWNWEAYVCVLAPPLPSNMTLGKSLNLLEVTLFTGL